MYPADILDKRTSGQITFFTNHKESLVFIGLQKNYVFMYKHINADKVAAPALRFVRLLDQLSERIRYLYYSLAGLLS